MAAVEAVVRNAKSFSFTYSTSEFSVKLVSFKVGLKDSTNV